MKIEKYRENHRGALFDLYRHFKHKYYCGEFSQARWSWRRACGAFPWYGSLGMPGLITENGGVIGCLDCLPNEISYQGETASYVTLTDFFVNESASGAGIFLIQASKKYAEIISCTNGSPEVLELFRKMGYNDLHRGHRAWHKTLHGLAPAVLNSLQAGRLKRLEHVKTGMDLLWSRTDSLDGLQQISARFMPGRAKCRREEPYLSWRLRDNPHGGYEVWTAARQDSDNLAYVIFKRLPHNILRLTQAIIYDFSLADDSGLTAEDFLRSVEALLDGTGCHRLTFYLCSPWEEHLRRNGYRLSWQDSLLVYSSTGRKTWLDNCHLTLLDTEKFLYL